MLVKWTADMQGQRGHIGTENDLFCASGIIKNPPWLDALHAGWHRRQHWLQTRLVVGVTFQQVFMDTVQ